MNCPYGCAATTKLQRNPATSGTDGLFTRPSNFKFIIDKISRDVKKETDFMEERGQGRRDSMAFQTGKGFVDFP